MNGSDIALIITACGTFVSAFAASAAVIISAINGRKINTIHALTNSLAERAEIGARAVGNLQGRVEQTAERAIARPTETAVETAVVRALDAVADKSLDKVADAVADKVSERVMEKKP